MHSMLFSNTNAPLKIILDQATWHSWQEHKKKALGEKGFPLEWADLGIILNDPYFFIVRDLVEFPDGKRNGYSRMLNKAELKGGVGVAILPQFREKLMVLEIFRHATRSWHYEIPRGFGEAGLSAEQNARKELFEETGSKTEELRALGSIHVNTGLEASAVSLHFARLSSVGEVNINEGIRQVIWLSVQELEEWIDEGRITDGFTIVSYVRAKLRKLI
jgi:ADP-ribose pyrophosphatase